ncbi:hypothetical protein GCM10023156_41700 [Novipirellula rosea]|uniref:Uncharacterized protein n=1 Tax=Novipirellula rosea TaxID=1031540 RepID=A0ABP8N621_9BACT
MGGPSRVAMQMDEQRDDLPLAPLYTGQLMCQGFRSACIPIGSILQQTIDRCGTTLSRKRSTPTQNPGLFLAERGKPPGLIARSNSPGLIRTF